jgi:hypothetical protein
MDVPSIEFHASLHQLSYPLQGFLGISEVCFYPRIFQVRAVMEETDWKVDPC